MKSPLYAWTNFLCTQWCQDPLAPSHSDLSSQPWFILGTSHWKRTVQTCTHDLYPWISSRCCQTWHIYYHWCSPSYTWVLTWNASSETSTSSPSHCTCCSSNNPTKPSCSCNFTKHSKEICSAYSTSHHPLEMYQLRLGQHLLPFTNLQESRNPHPIFLRRCDPEWHLKMYQMLCWPRPSLADKHLT